MICYDGIDFYWHKAGLDSNWIKAGFDSYRHDARLDFNWTNAGCDNDLYNVLREHNT